MIDVAGLSSYLTTHRDYCVKYEHTDARTRRATLMHAMSHGVV